MYHEFSFELNLFNHQFCAKKNINILCIMIPYFFNIALIKNFITKYDSNHKFIMTFIGFKIKFFSQKSIIYSYIISYSVCLCSNEYIHIWKYSAILNLANIFGYSFGTFLNWWTYIQLLVQFKKIYIWLFEILHRKGLQLGYM